MYVLNFTITTIDDKKIKINKKVMYYKIKFPNNKLIKF